jgi:hypothetical protein
MIFKRDFSNVNEASFGETCNIFIGNILSISEHSILLKYQIELTCGKPSYLLSWSDKGGKTSITLL